jgi:16S rRNA (adenine1518-N6/adenine1519-N6)-dimethyltransferase
VATTAYIMKAKKSFGQHFLNREDVAEKIASSFKRADSYKAILEVGPGKGVLTKYLYQGEIDFLAVEADRDMVEYLEHYYKDLRGKIIQEDFLRLDLSRVFEGRQFGLIGNFPYNISSQILIRMLEYKEFIPEMVGMFQKELAERVISGPGSKVYGVISVLVQAYYDCEYLFSVQPGSFSPPPKVKSGVIRLERKENPLENYNEKLFKIIVKTAFNQRRKMLRNTIKALVPDENKLKDAFFNLRPEQLLVKDFVELTHFVEKNSPTHVSGK